MRQSLHRDWNSSMRDGSSSQRLPMEADASISRDKEHDIKTRFTENHMANLSFMPTVLHIFSNIVLFKTNSIWRIITIYYNTMWLRKILINHCQTGAHAIKLHVIPINMLSGIFLLYDYTLKSCDYSVTNKCYDLGFMHSVSIGWILIIK